MTQSAVCVLAGGWMLAPVFGGYGVVGALSVGLVGAAVITFWGNGFHIGLGEFVRRRQVCFAFVCVAIIFASIAGEVLASVLFSHK